MRQQDEDAPTGMMPDESAGPDVWVGAVDLGPLGRTLSFALRRAQAAVAEDFAARFAAEDIRPLQFAMLTVLRHNPGLRQAQVSFALGIKRTNFVPLIDELERRGLAERRRVPGDRRAAALFLTRAGAAALDRLEAIAREHEARFVARLGAANHAALLRLLARLAERGLDEA
jgi:DNA-binding MarR family transcriptional regulator